MLEAGMQAPAFMLADKDGRMVSLSDFLGKKVVLYFYPKDNTPGCTRQACAFAAAYGEFEKKNAVVIGISKDSVTSHEKFAEKYNLPFILLSDPELQAIQAYGVWQEKKTVRKDKHGRRPHDVSDRRKGHHRKSHAQSQAGYECNRNVGIALKQFFENDGVRTS